MTKSEIKNLEKRVNQLHPPQPKGPFSSRRFAVGMKEAVETLTRKLGETFLTDCYGKNYRSSVLEVIRKAEGVDYEDAEANKSQNPARSLEGLFTDKPLAGLYRWRARPGRTQSPTPPRLQKILGANNPEHYQIHSEHAR